MNEKDIAEQAYKNGYEKGKQEAQKEVEQLTAFKNEAISMSLYGKGRKDGEEVARAELESLNKAYIELDLECRGLRTELDNISQTLAKELAEHEEFTKKAKAEIERLTEEANQDSITHIDLCTENLSLRKQNAELQKQVDELTDKLGKVLSGIKADEFLVAKGVEQAVKDTANKIFRQVLKLYQGLSKGERETMTFEWKLLDLAVEYGVEVE